MLEITGNLWDYHKIGSPIVITTNGAVRKDGCCVMGRGIAAQAVAKFPNIASTIGQMIRLYGNNVHYVSSLSIFTFPVKHHWSEVASLDLITRSCAELLWKVNYFSLKVPVYMPRPGCGNGQLSWDVVRPLLADTLDDRFIICEIKPNA